MRKVKSPTILQMEAVECGAAALAMVLAYHGKHVPLEKLRVECGVSRDGSKASNMIKAARKLDFIAKGFRKEPEDLKNLKGPMIIHWNFNHFIVLDGFKGKYVYLNDPAVGRRRLTYEEFDQQYTGVVLTFEKSPDFKKSGKKEDIWENLANRLTGSYKEVGFLFLASLALVIPGVVIPAFSKIFVDNVLLKGMQNWLSILLIAMLSTALLQGVLTWIREHYLLKLETKIALTSSAKFFWHILRLPVRFFTQRYAGEIGNRVALNDSVANLLAENLATIAVDFIVIIFYGILLFIYDPVLTVVGILIAALNIIFLNMIIERVKEGNMRQVMEQGNLAGVSMAGLQLIETLKASGQESDFFTRWAGHHAKILNSTQEIRGLSVYLQAIPQFLTTFNTTIILILGGMRVLDGFITIGTLIAFQSLMGSFLGPVTKLVGFSAMLEQVKADMKKLDDVFHYPVDTLYQQNEEDVAKKLEQTESPKLEGTIEVKGLSFGYNLLEPALIENFSLKLEPGYRVALVGSSGSGKSTIARIIAGLYEPWEGEILFDGQKREQIPKQILNNSIALVDQNICLFEGSIRQNISLWDTSIFENEVIQAAKDASIHEDISVRVGGYEHELEEGGRNFSGGQRQRLEIARALAGQPRILILDEATSALDPKTEKMVDISIRERGCTCVIVAHRLSTIRDCDEIIVLDKGKIVERGDHDHLMDKGTVYPELIKMH